MTKRNLLAVHRHSFLMLLIAITLFACSSDNDNNDPTPLSFTPYDITFDSLKYWVDKCEGSKCDSAMMIVQWNDEEYPDAWAWGYKWSAGDTKTGYDMINDIAETDKRFFYIKHLDTTWGYSIGGIGYDYRAKTDELRDSVGDCKKIIKGSIETGAYNFDYWTLCDLKDTSEVRWKAGWLNGSWVYWETDTITSKWEYSSLGVSSRVLKNGSVDAWYFKAGSTPLGCINTSTWDTSLCDGRQYIDDIEPVETPPK